jgi:hypothetical protein
MKKKAFALRINSLMLEKLEKWAADEFRSVNGQIEWILHQALKDAGRMKSTDPLSADSQDNPKDHQPKP